MGFLEKFKPNSLKIKEPVIDIIDKDKQIIVSAELPGIEKKNLSVKVKKDSVEIKAEKKEEKEIKEKDFYKHERSYGSFYRMFSLPADIMPSKAKKEFKNGVLKLSLPKAKK